MGIYTEIFVNTDFKEDTPQEVINAITAMCNKDHNSEWLKDKPKRWSWLFNNGSYYTPSTECGKITYDTISCRYSLLAKGDIKNYNCEIEDFFDFIKPWCEEGFIGYYRYEDAREPTLVYTTNSDYS